MPSYKELGFDDYVERSDIDVANSEAALSGSLVGNFDGGAGLLDNIPAGSITYDKLAINTLLVNQFIRGGADGYDDGTGFWIGHDGSDYKFFIGDSTGNKITWDGSTLNVSGVLTAGEIHIPDQDTTANSFHVDSTANTWWGCTETNFNADNDNATAYVLNTGVAKFQSVTLSSSVKITGLTSDTVLDDGTAGGWTMTGTTLANSTNIILDAGNKAIYINDSTFGNQGVQIEYNAGTPRAYIGDGANQFFQFDGTNISWQGTNSSLTAAGVLSASNVLITGGSVDSTQVTNFASGSEIAIQSWTYSGAFSVTDADTVAWAGGTLTIAATGETFTITGSNTGNMAALTYIYFDRAASTTAFQVSTSFTAGSGKILIATAQNGASEASYLLMGGSGDYYLDGTNFTAGSIIANKLSVSQLSAITADLGTITAGTVTGAILQTASSGTRFVMTSTAFQGYDSGGNVTFEVIINGANAGDVIIGDDATGKYVQWDNSAGTLDLVGSTINASVSLEIGGTAVTATATEINQALDGISANVTDTNLNTMTAGRTSYSNNLHSHIPAYFSLNRSVMFNAASVGGVPVYTDDIDYLPFYISGTSFGVYDATPGGDKESRTVTSDWASATVTGGIAKIGSFVYVLLYNGSNESRVYRYAYQDLASGGTNMTIAGATSFGTAGFAMTTDGTDLWMTEDAGNSSGNSHIFRQYTISGTTLTSSSQVTCGASAANFSKIWMDRQSNFYGYNSSDGDFRRYNSSGTLQSTTTDSTTSSLVDKSITIAGVPFFFTLQSSPSDSPMEFIRIPLLPSDIFS